MRYCARCVLPDTRPNLVLDEKGVCNACRASERREDVDWAARAEAFAQLVKHAKAFSSGYDCLIPVSGGKDSTWQVVTCLEHDLRVLAVTWRPPARTPIGERNLRNLVSLGVDHIDYQVSPSVERTFMRKALERFGDTGIPMHMALFNIPLKIAARFRIPLVVWGENSAVEYGSTDAALEGISLDERWLTRYGVMQGTTAADWVDDELGEKALAPYVGPSAAELAAANVTAVFLGEFFGWDPERSLEVALAHGFSPRPEGPKVGYYDYADIDDDFISIHHYLKWHKFGFTRTFDNLSLEIRHGRMTREEAVDEIRRRGDETPWADIDRFCEFTGLDRERFFDICDSFRDPTIWSRRDGAWTIEGFLVPDWSWA